MRYRMIGLDLDGTLLHSRGEITPGNLAAIRRAQARGVLVIPSTGRSWHEARRVLAPLAPPPEAPITTHDPALKGSASSSFPGVYVTGSLVCDVVSGKVLDAATIPPAVVMTAVRELAQWPEAVLLFRNRDRVGHDYLVTGGPLHANTRWWFTHHVIPVKFQDHVTEADLHDVVRIGIVSPAAVVLPAIAHLKQVIGSAITVHSFEVLRAPGQTEPMEVMELFAAGVDKWRGLQWAARQYGIAEADIAVMGDQINDLQMMRQAGCRIAMGNAIAQVKDEAHHVTLHCDEDGVGHAIDRLLAGAWG